LLTFGSALPVEKTSVCEAQRKVRALLEMWCTSCYKTQVIPFRVAFEPGISLYEQVVYAAKKAVVTGQLRAGDAFPSVRELSKSLKINPNTAHKVVMHLVAEGVLEVHSGIGTVVTKRSCSSAADRSNLLQKELEQLIVEAKRLGLTFDDVTTAVDQLWKRLDGSKK
jgi:DNA-binding transcriptional regulator YhcF (GntR family)